MEGSYIPSDDNYNHFLCIYLPVLHMFLEENNLLNTNFPIYYGGKYIDILSKYSKNILPEELAPKNVKKIEYHPRSLDADLNLKVRNVLMHNIETNPTGKGLIIKRQDRNISNLEQIKNIISDKFNILLEEIDFCELSFDEQIKLVNGSNLLFGVHGAGLSNLMFMRQDSIVIEFDPFDWGFNCFEHLAKNLQMKNYIRICENITKDKYIKEFKANSSKFVLN